MQSQTTETVKTTETDKPTERLTEAENVLSWDCGLSNLSYCLLEFVNTPTAEFKIRFWENFSLNETNVTNAVEALVRELESRPWMMRADHICIESQMSDNTTMKVISHALQTYFNTKAFANQDSTPNLLRRCGPKVHFVSPQNKFKVTTVPDVKMKPGHARNKKIAILMAKKVLAKQKESTCLHFLESHKKQDDLCDCLLQGIYFLRKLNAKKRTASKLMHLIGHKPTTEVLIREDSDPKDAKRASVYRSDNFPTPFLYTTLLKPVSYRRDAARQNTIQSFASNSSTSSSSMEVVDLS